MRSLLYERRNCPFVEPLAKLLKQGGFRLRRGGVTVLK
jgi:hypothetical protein